MRIRGLAETRDGIELERLAIGTVGDGGVLDVVGRVRGPEGSARELRGTLTVPRSGKLAQATGKLRLVRAK